MAAREAAKSAQTLDELRGLLERFDGCALRATATQLVFADGNPQGRVMFVGEAPGYEEDVSGKSLSKQGRAHVRSTVTGNVVAAHDGCGPEAKEGVASHREKRKPGFPAEPKDF